MNSNNCKSFLLLILVIVDCSWGHLRLTYPPARKYDLDFLDNARTAAPCGMPSGMGPRTTLLQGSTLNVSWHLAYAHRGGYRLEILEGSTPVHYLTPANQYIGSHDVTILVVCTKDALGVSCAVLLSIITEQHQVKLPDNYTCDSCTIRVRRQASEWGGNYIFWSCADVSIGPDECEDDSDCNHGQCVTASEHSFPQKQCYCQAGWFGLLCEQESSVKSTEFDPILYHKRALDPRVTMYHRVVKETNELEVVMQSNTSGYLALGWRSNICPSRSMIPLENQRKSRPESLRESLLESLRESLLESLRESLLESLRESLLESLRKSLLESLRKSLLESPTGSQLESPRGSQLENPTESQLENPTESQLENPTESQLENPTESQLENPTESQLEKPTESQLENPTESQLENPTESQLENPTESQLEKTTESQLENTTESQLEKTTESQLENPTESQLENPTENPTGEPDGEPDGEPTGEPDGEPNGKPDGEPTGEPDGEPDGEPTGEPDGEPNGKPDGEPTGEPDGEPTGEPDGEPTGEPDGEPTGEPDGEPDEEPDGEPTNEGADPNLHEMDCIDVTIGLAKKNLHQVRDYYTPDRSTPRLDEEYGGTQSLSAAIASQQGDTLTMIFRRKLKATEPSDYSIDQGKNMHVVWARGQTELEYHHSPRSGIETGETSDTEFYGRGEIKYHGHGAHRGYLQADLSADVPEKTSDECRGQFMAPGCTDSVDCAYVAKWTLDEESDIITFDITAKQDVGEWTGIAFSEQPAMENTEVHAAYFGNTGIPYHGWIGSRYAAPQAVDPLYNANAKVSHVDGKIGFVFSRPRTLLNGSDGLSFTDNQCLYFFFPVGGGPIINGIIGKHALRPNISPVPICVKSCFTEKRDEVDVYMGVKLHLDFEFFKDESTWENLDNLIIPQIEDTFKSVPGFKKIKRQQYREGSVIAVIQITGEADRAQFEEDISNAMDAEMEDGALGSLPADKTYTRVFSVQPEEDDLKDEEESSPGKLDEEDIIIIIFATLLGLLFIMVVVVGCIKCRERGIEIGTKRESKKFADVQAAPPPYLKQNYRAQGSQYIGPAAVPTQDSAMKGHEEVVVNVPAASHASFIDNDNNIGKEQLLGPHSSPPDQARSGFDNNGFEAPLRLLNEPRV
ncbi:hypothetical protein CAPTEDRAFT_222245 [Capitella teleta]|uniref:EGF-like domain-containing protein n=1 Tax=Capitella teleta TaxID=283909 RepID=R7UL81_CAPTE|nr:hypothetical protein CAPTEDRAFT_222245 [Capitella teleta]|eukprot:ELU07299.1 hypothetical protein CAPTEDRAFT_222245 [Capitella teleta]